MKLIISAISLLTIVVACRPKYEPTPLCSYKNDYEDLIPFVQCDSYLWYKITNNGGYKSVHANKIDSGNFYGIAFDLPVKNISNSRISCAKVQFQAKSQYNNQKEISLVFSVQDSTNANIHWERINICGRLSASTNKWKNYNHLFDLFKFAATPNNRIIFYVWNGDSKEQVLVDDFEVIFY